MAHDDAAERLVEEGRAYSEVGDVARAEEAYRAACALEPEWPVPAFNLGLLYKYQGRWNESFECNQRAAALAPDDQGSWWNLGIAATALGRWSDARHAWAECGIKDPGGDDPPIYRFGRTAIRLDPAGDGEVVWGTRLDPARTRLTNIPLPSSAFRWGDIVLQDGAIEGQRVVEGVTYPVFNALERLVPSTIYTFIVELASVDDAAVTALEDLAAAHGGAAENWGSTTRILCRQCSFGIPHEHHPRAGPPAHPHCGLVVPARELAEAILTKWLDTTSSADLVTWYEHSA